MPSFTILIHYLQLLKKCKHVNKNLLPSPSYIVNIGLVLQGKKFPSLPIQTKFTFIKHKILPKYENNNTNVKLLYLNNILIDLPLHKQKFLH